jgi:hypothetical protein
MEALTFRVAESGDLEFVSSTGVVPSINPIFFPTQAFRFGSLDFVVGGSGDPSSQERTLFRPLGATHQPVAGREVHTCTRRGASHAGSQTISGRRNFDVTIGKEPQLNPAIISSQVMTIRGLDLVVRHLDDLLDFVTDRVSGLNYGDPVSAHPHMVTEYPTLDGGMLSFHDDTNRHGASPGPSADSQFVGMVEYAASIHELLEDPSFGDTSSEAENPEGMGDSRECFMVDVVNTTAKGGAKSTPVGGGRNTEQPPPQLTPKQQEAYQRERAERLKSRRVDLEVERAKLDRKKAKLRAHNTLLPTPSGVRAPACQTDPAVVDAGESAPHFNRAGQNITAVAILLCAVPEPDDPEAR